jgi:lysophospholipase L1-like esterase
MRSLNVALFAVAILAYALEPMVAAQTSKVDGTLMLFGASYVASWHEPDLGYSATVNRGVGGEDPAAMRARFERDVLDAAPAAVLIWGHINGIHRAPEGSVDAVKESIRDDYRDMVARARARGITVLLATEVTLSEAVGWRNRLAAFVGGLLGKSGYSAWVNQHVREVNAWLRDFARDNGLTLLDFEAALDDGEGFRRLEYSEPDGTHISPAAYAVLTDYTRAQLRP